MLNIQNEGEPKELPEKIRQELLIKSSVLLDRFITQVAKIGMAVSIIRLFCILVLEQDVPKQLFIGPILSSALVLLQSMITKDSVQKFNFINAAFKIMTTLAFTEIIRSKGSSYAPFYLITFQKFIFIYDQVQVFPQKYQQFQTIAIHLVLILRNSTDAPYYGFTLTHLSIILGGLAIEYYSIQNFEGINVYLKKQLLQIQKLEQRWSTLLKHLKIGILTYASFDRSLTFCNGAMLKMFSLELASLKEIQNQLLSVIMIQKENQQRQEFSLAEFLNDKFDKIVNKEIGTDSSFTLKIKGSKKVVEISFQLCQDEEKSVLVMVNEITSLKKLEKSKQIERMKTIYFCSVAHDLKTPINSIQATNHYLSYRFKEDKEIIRLINVISTSCQFLIRTIQDITDLSKIELKQFELEYSWFDLQDLIREVREVMSLPFEMKKISLKIDSLEPKHLTRQIYSDSKRIKQILLNLIGNALKFTLTGGVTVSVQLKDSPQAAEDERREQSEEQKQEDERQGEQKVLLFRVIDTGIGIKEENLTQLFKLFGKIREQNDINKQGIGLGLTICKKLTELMGGEILVKSEYEKGTEFSFTAKCKIMACEIDEDFKTFTTISDFGIESQRRDFENYLQSFIYEKRQLSKIQKQA